MNRFTEGPLFAGSSAKPGAPIESADLNPIAGQPAAYAAVSTPNSLRDRGWTVEGAPIVEVSAADTAQSLSAGFGVPVSVILEANGLTTANQVRPGQRLIIPTYVRVDNPKAVPAAVAAAAVTPPQTAQLPLGPGESRHIVQAGDNLDRLAGAYRVPATEIARINGLAPGQTLVAGSSLRIPQAQGAFPGASATMAVAASAPPASTPAAAQVLAAPAVPAPVVAAAPAAPAAPVLEAPKPTQVAALPAPSATMSDAGPDVQDDGGDGFRWPVKGRIITGFGKQADGARNDGINLAVAAGTPVRAAQEGTVIYAGNELAGYGNLVLVQHEGDWVSAYAHADALKVKRGDKISRGQTIATVGKTGSVDSPQLHFELRRKSKPVDPLPQLSGT